MKKTNPQIQPNQLALLSTILGIIISNNLNSNQQNAFGNFLEAIGQIILTINAQSQNISYINSSSNNSNYCNSSEDSKKTNSDLDDLKKEMKKLKKHINMLENKLDNCT